MRDMVISVTRTPARRKTGGGVSRGHNTTGVTRTITA